MKALFYGAEWYSYINPLDAFPRIPLLRTAALTPWQHCWDGFPQTSVKMCWLSESHCVKGMVDSGIKHREP